MIKNIIFDIGGIIFDDSLDNISKVLGFEATNIYRKAYGRLFRECLLGNLDINDYIKTFKDDLDYEKIKYILSKENQHLVLPLINDNFNYISKLNKLLREHFKKNKKIHINSPENSIPNTLNISLIDTNTKEVLHKLEEKEIYLSTTTACAIGDAPSKSVLAITGDKELASNTIRISISHNTTKKDINTFIKEFDNILKKYITKK